MIVLKNKALLSITLAVLMAAGLLVVGLMSVVESARAAFPGQNGKIAFASNRNAAGNYEIYTVSSTGTSTYNRITNDGAIDYAPDWQRLSTGGDGTQGGCTRTGTTGNDNLVGTNSRDVICGLDGDDTLRRLLCNCSDHEIGEMT
jgi:Ca2+-binding RTX toxin-like protein